MEARRKPRPGDVLEVQLDSRVAYLHYLGKHSVYGDAIRVLDTESLPTTAQAWDTAIANGYIAFYPVVSASGQGLLTVVGHHDEALGVPRKVRRAGARDKEGKVRRWVIEQGNRIDSRGGGLSAEQRALPIAAIWNHAMLCKRIAQGWRPEKDA